MLTQTASVEMLYSAMLAHQQQLRSLAQSMQPLSLQHEHHPYHHQQHQQQQQQRHQLEQLEQQQQQQIHVSPRFAMDPNMRRKNATRESTSILKSWLEEHRKNPYPTKGEKIMLAIITKMTLTQVSTWFANARRRLKKDNRVTWLPRNRCGEDGDDEDDVHNESDGDIGSVEDYNETVELMRRRQIPSASSMCSADQNVMLMSHMRSLQDLEDVRRRHSMETQKRKEVFIDVGTEASPAVFPSAYQLPASLTTSGVRPSTKTENEPASKKPKIWSVVDVAADKPSPTQTPPAGGPLFPFPVEWLQHPAALALRSAFGSATFPPQFPQVSSTQHLVRESPSPVNLREKADDLDRSSPAVSTILGRRRRISGSSSISGTSSVSENEDELNAVSGRKSIAINLHQIASLTR